MERKLVSIRTIERILPIVGADRIELAVIGAWRTIVPKDVYKSGDKVLYFEIDSFIPNDNAILAPFIDENMRARTHKNFNGCEGILIRTIKLRGEYSQGWILPLEGFKNLNLEEGKDLSEVLGVLKYELINTSVRDVRQKGVFPPFFPKTDCERIQNLALEDLKLIIDQKVELTYKYDGTSFSNFYNNGETGICSRNMELKVDHSDVFTKVAFGDKIKDYCERNGKNLAFQGELVGPNIQKNKMGLLKPEVFIFNIYDIDEHCYLEPGLRRKIVDELGLKHVEIFDNDSLKSGITLGEQIGVTPEEFKKMDEFNKQLTLERIRNHFLNIVDIFCNTQHEGVVIKTYDGKTILKVISNSYILK